MDCMTHEAGSAGFASLAAERADIDAAVIATVHRECDEICIREWAAVREAP